MSQRPCVSSAIPHCQLQGGLQEVGKRQYWRPSCDVSKALHIISKASNGCQGACLAGNFTLSAARWPVEGGQRMWQGPPATSTC